MSVKEHPARLTISGQVLAVQTDIHTFVMTIRQNISGAPVKERLKIRVLLGFNAVWPDTHVRLPVQNGLVSFTGEFLAFEGGVALVGLDDIAYIPRLFFDSQTTVIGSVQ